jgi:hypothetical protein
MNDTDLQTRVREALKRTDIMALSTIDQDGGPWTSPVQYQSDSQLNLYLPIPQSQRSSSSTRTCPSRRPASWLPPGMTSIPVPASS